MADNTVANCHPEYVEQQGNWLLMRDAAAGEETVKSKTFTYLKPTAGQVLDGAALHALPAGNPGMMAYLGYLDRAQFPDHVEIGIETLVGILNSKPAIVKVPEKMQPILEKFSANGSDVGTFLRQLHAEQLTVGRVGIFIDMPATLNPNHKFPYAAMYKAEDIINWDEGITEDGVDKVNLVVLRENVRERGAGLTWSDKEQERVLVLNSENPAPDIGADPNAKYRFAVQESSTNIPDTADFKTPSLDGRTLDSIPFVFVNSKDLACSPDKPPLLGLARMCYSIYRGEADYRETLYLQSQETLVVVGGITNAANGDDSVRVGSGARIDVSIGGDAKYIGVSGAGLSEQRAALENDHKRASVRTGQLLAPGKASLESGESLKTRLASQTATLSNIAVTGALALQQALRYIAEFCGENPEECTVTPNLDFVKAAINGQDLVQIMTAKSLGAPISQETIHELIAERGLTRKSFDEEVEAAKKDPEVFEPPEPAESSNSLTGNNPVQSAGGPKRDTTGNQTGKGNQPKE